jgi:hypothetical protein
LELGAAALKTWAQEASTRMTADTVKILDARIDRLRKMREHVEERGYARGYLLYNMMEIESFLIRLRAGR